MKRLETFPDARLAASALLETFLSEMDPQSARPVHVALSGGQTASLLFRVWVEQYALSTPWERLRFYWVDERCVPPSHSESNFGNASRLLLKPLQIPFTHVHRIVGEGLAEKSCGDYLALLPTLLPFSSVGIPLFDFVFLGMGTDGHTSSIFPGQKGWKHTSSPYVVVRNAPDGLTRIALTVPSLIAARHTFFLVVGREKESVIRQTVSGKAPLLPASYVWSHAHDGRIFTDVQNMSVSSQ